ncbi:Phosphotransferase enzyme family protein [Lentzea waywayandensis]|uniref:Phosphotransferase enzyme family protein n=1 Tax=Lentzea waywayandensis TaxID=84724 RepID=A0A1I6EC24_9PSEU|nr:phosphotransferase [Lentzea waywayandensis]SFR15299.1 Phosphotransferase enzyme family protein [Lentzea waywayandensis]
MNEQPLSGGFVSHVVRIGDTVRRGTTDRSEFVHRLLHHFEQHAWPGAPRFLGVDEQGREVLTFLDGHVPAKSQDGLAQVARLVRQFHDLTAGTPLAGDQEVVCHNDLSPKNTVYRDRSPVAFVDWDLAAPGARVHDVAHMCWQYLGLGPAVDDLATTSERLRMMCDAYGLTDRSQVVETILWWQDRCRRGIETGTDAAMTRLRDSGAARSVRAAHEWVTANRAALEVALK